ncbi:hypothetical protein ASG52_12220 [Methylobacterium sp. Leaf456]|uniref:DUF3307 domain-containing protein n=1 Tax=Methylobacterium sp. Leaf456 TaxID=1736382 RepID=UPI0006FB86D0|nr:DUF3307 domain-containing protein [Methylobacterium sp. Leaf456]KQT46828.1 hypothetical protein ASG52_12220 [Methylobacterium sp. Leaf456]
MPSASLSVPLVPFVLLAAGLALKHVVADFLFQTGAIARGKERRHGWLAPLALHALGHAGLTLALALALAPRLWWLAPVDFTIHFCADRGKSMLGHRLGLSTDDVRFWWLIGFDQFLHQLTNLGLAAALATL